MTVPLPFAPLTASLAGDRFSGMVNRIHRWTLELNWSLLSLRRLGAVCLLAVLLLFPSVSGAISRGYTPQAHITSVDRSFISQGITPASGAGIRFFEDPDSGNSGTERFDIRWYANPPGLPPGVIVMVETQQERNSVIKNHILRLTQKSEGNLLSVIEVPPEEIRQAGRVLQWRVRIIWRGKALASQVSQNWSH